MAAAPLTDAVPYPVVGPWTTTAADQENQTTPPLVTSRTLMATSAVAQVCRAFRVAFLSSVEHLCVEVRGGEEEPGVVLPRWAALATTLRRLTSLRTLGLRLFTLRPSWVLHLVANLLADTLGGGVPSLRALSLTSRGYLNFRYASAIDCGGADAAYPSVADPGRTCSNGCAPSGSRVQGNGESPPFAAFAGADAPH